MNARDMTRGGAGVSQFSPLQLAAIEEAADWYARLQTEKDTVVRDAWRVWHANREENRWAWDRIAQVRARFGQVPAGIATATLAAPMQRQTRRAMLRGMVGLTVLAGGTVVGYRVAQQQGWAYGAGELVTGLGERRQITLADGSLLSINTRSRVDVVFTATQRLIRLHQGEVLISTRPDGAAARPFAVETAEGRVLALGTRFNVRSDDGVTHVAVLEKAVEVSPARVPTRVLRLKEGQAVAFTHAGIEQPGVAEVSAGSWETGRLLVVNMPLRKLLAELSRYRRGYLSCDDAVADLPVSGAFPLDDTEQALLALTEAFPVQLKHFTRYWVTVVPAA